MTPCSLTKRNERVDEMNCLLFEGTSMIKSNATYCYTDNTRLVSWLATPRGYEGRRSGRTHRVYFQGKRKTDISKPINRLTPNDPYMGRTAPLTSKRCILYIYSTNIGTEYFKHALYSPFFFLFKMQFVS